MQPLDEIARGGFGQFRLAGQFVDLHLHPDMGGRFELEIAPFLVAVEVTLERALDIAWARVMTFDQVAVLGVHHPHEACEVRSRTWMERPSQRGRCRGDLRYDIRNRLAGLFQPGGLYPVFGLDQCHDLADSSKQQQATVKR